MTSNEFDEGSYYQPLGPPKCNYQTCCKYFKTDKCWSCKNYKRWG